MALHCFSDDPVPADNYNPRTIPDIAKRFEVITGLSDHTIDNSTALSSVALASCLIDKHVTMCSNGGGADERFSLEPLELKELCKDANIA
ncbi:N-acetylneuraminate synthase family protein [Alteromonas sp. LMIT006]|uniref:N-acetylneuraminate synthase family protein n=1 Tax=Alteromonadaceae TaxID=72275 RepID=UPI0020CA2BAF|nr:N-acetylneuraminate synthase family protein [Alteromonas sp. LMIT006]UTP73832.1 N-acetylneuraminate synthase family protein [Alteromonas sp. LMIT006]